MAQKPIKHDLMWKAIAWTFYQFSKLPPSEQRARTLRVYQNGDGKLAADAVRTVRMAYYYEMKAYREGKRGPPDFEWKKGLVMESLKMEHGWSEETRALISSIVSTYITWDYRGISEVSERKLRVIVAYSNMFLRPTKDLDKLDI